MKGTLKYYVYIYKYINLKKVLIDIAVKFFYFLNRNYDVQ